MVVDRYSLICSSLSSSIVVNRLAVGLCPSNCFGTSATSGAALGSRRIDHFRSICFCLSLTPPRVVKDLFCFLPGPLAPGLFLRVTANKKSQEQGGKEQLLNHSAFQLSVLEFSVVQHF